MKKFLSYSLLAAAAAAGVSFAAEATTLPVGYETLSVKAGFNYLGVRLHSAAVKTGTLETIASGSVTDTGADFSDISANPTKMYILEIGDGSGVIVEFLGSAISGSSINITDNLVAAGVANNVSYKIRPAATLSSVFGATNSAGLATGFYSPGGDIIFVPNGSGGFAQYYYDTGYASWADNTGTPVDGNLIPLVYADGVILSATAPLSLTVSGEVKTTSTSLVMQANSFNYYGSVHPASATLASSFGGSLAKLDKGFYSPGGDIFFVPDGNGGFNQYYYDEGYASWANNSGTPVDGATVALPSGVIIFNQGPATDLRNAAPSSYASLQN